MFVDSNSSVCLCLSSVLLASLLRNPSRIQCCELSFPSAFASDESLVILGLTLRFLIHFEFVFVCGTRVQCHCLACGYPVFPALFVEKSVPSPWKGLNALSKLIWLYVWEFITVFSTNGESRHPCLVTDLRGKASSFSHHGLECYGFSTHGFSHEEMAPFYF